MAILAEQSRHGYDIVQQLTGLTMFRGHAPDATGVYRLLKTMQRDELVDSSWETADGGPAKRRYTLTPHGRDCLDCWIGTLTQYQESIADLLSRLKRASGGKRKRAK